MTTSRPLIRLIVVWLVLLGFLGGNIALAYAASGNVVAVAHVLIAVVMALIVLAVFMELDRGASLVWVFAGAGFFWLAILFAMTAADYWTRYNFAATGTG